MFMEMGVIIENFRVVSEIEESVILVWNIINSMRDFEVNVLYFKYGEKDLLMFNVDFSKN